MRLLSSLRSALLVLSCASAPQVAAQDIYIGEIRAFGFNYCPRFWLPADGSLLPIADHSALYSLLGTIYGGDGKTSFALPDLRGRAIIGDGIGPALPAHQIGSTGIAPGTRPPTAQTGHVAMKLCIATAGIFPPRR